MWNNENYNSKFGPKQVNNIIIIDIYSNFKKWFFLYQNILRICKDVYLCHKKLFWFTNITNVAYRKQFLMRKVHLRSLQMFGIYFLFHQKLSIYLSINTHCFLSVTSFIQVNRNMFKQANTHKNYFFRNFFFWQNCFAFLRL